MRRPRSPCAPAPAGWPPSFFSSFARGGPRSCGWPRRAHGRRSCSACPRRRDRIPRVRGVVSDAIRARTSSAFAAEIAARSPASKARLTAARRTSRANGFSRKSPAPAFMARTASGTSPWPVMMITGRDDPRLTSSSCSSNPSMPGIRISAIRQPRREGAPLARKAAAEPNASTLWPASFSDIPSDSRTASSSSTAKTVTSAVMPAGTPLLLPEGGIGTSHRHRRSAPSTGVRHGLR